MRVVRARCRAYADGVPYGVFVQLLCAALDLRPPLASADIVAARIRAVRSGARAVSCRSSCICCRLRSEVYALPRHLRGEHLQAALLDALAMFVGVLSRRQPIVVLVEDWHWADTGSRAAFSRLAELIPSQPRRGDCHQPGRAGRRTNWPSAATLVRLERLDFTSSTAIVEAVLGVRQITSAAGPETVPTRWRQSILPRTDMRRAARTAGGHGTRRQRAVDGGESALVLSAHGSRALFARGSTT